MSDVLPLQGPEKGPCGCGCGLYGALRSKPWRSGVRCVRRGCPCPSCRGGKRRAKGDAKASKARRTLGLGGPRSRHEESWRGAVLTEVKAGTKAKPVQTFYRVCRDQSDQSRAIGDGRPFVAVAMPDGESSGYAVMRLEDLALILEAL